MSAEESKKDVDRFVRALTSTTGEYAYPDMKRPDPATIKPDSCTWSGAPKMRRQR